MSETGRSEARLAVHAAFKRLDEFHRDDDFRLIQVQDDGRWHRAGTFETDYGTVTYEPITGFWVVSFEDDEGPTGVTEQVRGYELR